MAMTVKVLMDLLSEMDPEANVLIATQRSYPFENTVHGVVERSEYEDEEDCQDRNSLSGHPNDAAKTTDVLISCGRQTGYGSDLTWEHALTSNRY